MITVEVSSRVRIKLKQLDKTQIKALERICTVRNPEYWEAIEFNQYVSADTPAFLTAYDHKKGYIYIPRGVLEKAVNILGNKVLIEYKTASFNPIGLEYIKHMQDRAEQNEAADALLKYDDGILVSPTGSGKTNIMIKVMERVNQPTLVLVHRDFLLNQWKERIEEFLGYEVGIIGSGQWNVKNITVAMIPTLHANPKRMKELKKRFGLIIIDECHHIPAYTWLSNIINLGPNKIYGTSATAKRKDSLQRLMMMAVGPIRHVLNDQKAVKSGSIMPVKVKVIRTKYIGPRIMTKREFTKLAQNLILDADRNKLIVKTIVSESNRIHLVLSDRIQHIKILTNALRDTGKVQAEMLIGGTSMKKKLELFERVNTGQTNVIVASSVADEGLDLPILETLHLTFPTANPDRNMQQIGRIRRPFTNKKDAIVYDYFDWRNPTLNRQFQNRKRKYHANNFSIEYVGDVT